MDQWCVWLVVIIILVILEAMTVNLTTIWFVASGIIALAISFFTDNYVIQFGVFVILGVILLITTRPILLKTFKHEKEALNIDRVIGQEGIVTEKITPLQNGEVKVDGKRWTAYADEKIEEGMAVKVLEIKGVKIKVEKVSENK